MSLPVTLTSSPTSVNKKKFKEPSFSSYLNEADKTFVLKLRGKTTRSLDSSISIPRDHIFHEKARTEDAEIDVFDAEKYFKGDSSHIPRIATKTLPTQQMKKDDRAEIFALKKQHRITTPSIHSESSCNSRSALLAAISRNQQRRTNKKSFLAGIACSCFCRDKNSVTVDVLNRKTSFSKSTKSRNGRSRQRDKSSNHLVSNGQTDFNCIKSDELKVKRNSNAQFSFPVFNAKTGNRAVNIQENDVRKQKSVERFGYKYLENGENCLSLKKLSLSTWDSIAPETVRIPSVSCEISKDNDSDSSSDLFELESLSKSSIQASDIFSGYATSTVRYAPSEASIEWSVITADADYDVLSDIDELRSTAMITPWLPEVHRDSKNVGFKDADYVLSDPDELRFATTIAPQPWEAGQHSKNVGFKEMSNQHSRILSGGEGSRILSTGEILSGDEGSRILSAGECSRILCGGEHQKAITIVEHLVSDARRGRSESLTPMTRFDYKNNMLYA